jgi:manganese efflux pump family protein
LPASTLKLIAVVVPLGLDTLAVALALGLAGLPAGRRLHVSLLFAAFEAGMPLLGIALGAPLGRAIGEVADYIAAAMIVALGFYLLVERRGDGEEAQRLLSLSERGLVGAAALGLSISLDELAIGFSAGLLRIPVVPLVAAVAGQAFVVTQVGVRVGARVTARWREASERAAGLALVVLGAALLGGQLGAA